MLASITAIDLTRPIPAVQVAPHHERLLILARLGYMPVTIVSLALSWHQREVSPEQLRAVLVEAIGPQLWENGLAQLLQAQTDPAEWPPISVVVCTRDRAEALERCLTALKRLDYPDYEVVVVDNASRDQATAAVVERAGMAYVREERPGLDWARNRGAATARHAIIAYTDDDVQVDAGWLRGVARAFADPAVDAVTGLVMPVELETEAQALFERYGGMSKGVRQKRFQRDTLNEFGLIGAHWLGVGANMAFRRATLDQLDGFDTALDVGTPSGGGGDLDMFHRVMAAGLTFHYEPTALVWHQHRRDMAGLRKQIENNGRAFGTYLLKIWQRRSAPRRATLAFTYSWIRHYLLPQVFHSARRKHTLPVWLTLAELRGALDAPRAFRATYANDRRVRQAGMWTGTAAQRSQ